LKVKVKLRVFQEVKALRFQEKWYMKVERLSALRTGCLYTPHLHLPTKYSWYSFLLEAESTSEP
jgi:hypothetical protein